MWLETDWEKKVLLPHPVQQQISSSYLPNIGYDLEALYIELQILKLMEVKTKNSELAKPDWSSWKC